MSTVAITPDPETMSLEDLRVLANQAITTPTDPTPTPTPESVTPDSVPDDVDDPPPPHYYVREINLGDGSGVQVFKDETESGLADQLAEAQVNATRKIRELTRQQTPPPPKPTPTADPIDEMAISQELLSAPTAAFKKLFETATGMPLETFKSDLERVKAFEAGQREEAQARDFISATPDYYPIPANGNKLGAYLELHRLPATVENLQKAYTDLDASGLLAKKPGPKTDTPRIEDPAPPTTRRTTSTLSARRSTPVPTPTGPTEADLEKMSTDQLRELAERAVLGS